MLSSSLLRRVLAPVSSFIIHHSSFIVLLLLLASPALSSPTPGGYAVVVSKQTYADSAWKRVADALIAKHDGKLIVYDAAVTESLKPLQALFPRYTCFVATPTEASRKFVCDILRLTRKYDDDPYTDTIWGIVTGFDADNALRIASCDKPLTVRKVGSGTNVALDCCDEGIWTCELHKNKLVQKKPGGKPEETKGPDDTTAVLVNILNEYKPDLFVTSGHASEHNWQIGYSYTNGFFNSKAGKMFGLDTQKKTFPIDSPNPKVYLPIGNCLMGHIDGPDSMALAWMNSAGVYQMIGYTVTTWYGYAGWGCLDYFVEQPGRYSFAEAFIANQDALDFRINTFFPDLAKQQPEPGVQYSGPITLSDAARKEKLTANDARGLLHDRDVLALYGDPAWEAKMADGDKFYDQKLTEDNGLFTLEIKPLKGAKSFDPVNINGSQRGGRPMIQFLPHRIKNVQLVDGKDLNPVITDDFVLVPNPKQCDPAKSYRIQFRAEAIK